MELSYSYLVTYGDVDAQAVVYNGRYMDVVDDFIHHYLSALYANSALKLSSFEVENVVIDYLAPCRLGDRMVVKVDDCVSLSPEVDEKEDRIRYELVLSIFVSDVKVSAVVVRVESIGF